ncbi:MAG: TIGR03435 family protein, partial [Terriglobales bacterium]
VREWAPGTRPPRLVSGVQLTPGRLTDQCASLKSLLFFAYGLTFATPIEGAPAWASSACGVGDNPDTYLVQATMPAATTRAQAQQMMQALLAERFKLAAHWASKPGDVYALRIARGGAKIRAWSDQLAAATKGRKYGCPADDRNCNLIIEPDAPIADLVSMLSLTLRKPVADRTGLQGNYDATLEWAGDFSSNSSLPSLKTALRDNFGFELRQEKGEIRTLVIDHVEKLKAN